MEDKRKFEAGWLNIIQSSASQGRALLFDAIREQMQNGDGEAQSALLVWVDREGLAIQAQRNLADVINGGPSRKIAILQPTQPFSRGITAYLRDYLTKTDAKKFNGLYIDTSNFVFHHLDKSARVDLAREMRQLLTDLNMFGFLAFVPEDLVELPPATE